MYMAVFIVFPVGSLLGLLIIKAQAFSNDGQIALRMTFF
jgi:hypothetical protein